MNQCARPLDPLDCEALASGEEPLSASDAALHAASCPSCQAAVGRAGQLLTLLGLALANGESGAEPPVSTPDLASRVLRLRPFSRRERHDLRLWAGPAGFAGLLFATGLAVLAAPGFGLREQTGLGVAILAPLAGLTRAILRAFGDVALSAPSAWQVVSDAARQDASLGLAALLLLAPAGFGLRRVLARAGRRG